MNKPITLNDYGFEHPLESGKKYLKNWRFLQAPKYNKYYEEVDIMAMQKAESGDVFKFEKEGDKVSGILIGTEESKQYAGSFAVTLKQPDGSLKVCFVTGIVMDLLKRNSVEEGHEVVIEFMGKKPSKTNPQYSYNDYEIMFDKEPKKE